MAIPTIASYLTFQNDLKSGSVFAPGALPKLSGTVKSEGIAAGSLPVYARLYTPDGRFIWHRTMPYAGTVGGSPVYEYQTQYLSGSPDQTFFLTFGANITGGSWRLAFYGVSTEAIAPPGAGAGQATDAQIKAAIQRHPDIGSDVNVYVNYASSLKRLTIGFSGRFAKTKWPPEYEGIKVWQYVNDLTGNPKPGIAMTAYASGTGDFPNTSGEYQMDMVAFDNVSNRFSGNATSIRTALGPSPLTFYIDEAPTIGSMSPANAAVVTVSNPTMSWTQTNLGNVPITDIRGYIYEAGTTTNPVHTFRQTGANLNSVTSYTLPARTLKNGGTYTWFLDIFKKSGAVTKSNVTFTVTFTRPAAHAAAFSVATDGAYIDVSWTASALSDADFNSYVIKAREVGQAEDGPQNIEVWRSTSKALNVKRIFKFPRNVPMILSFYVRKNVAGDVVDYLPTSTTQTVNINSVLIANPGNQEYVLLPWHRGRRLKWNGGPTPIPVWSVTKPVANMPTQRYRTVGFVARVKGTSAFRRSQWAKLESLYFNDPATALVYADAFGQWFDFFLDEPELDIPEGGWDTYDFTISGFEGDAVIEGAA